MSIATAKTTISAPVDPAIGSRIIEEGMARGLGTDRICAPRFQMFLRKTPSGALVRVVTTSPRSPCITRASSDR